MSQNLQEGSLHSILGNGNTEDHKFKRKRFRFSLCTSPWSEVGPPEGTRKKCMLLNKSALHSSDSASFLLIFFVATGEAVMSLQLA